MADLPRRQRQVLSGLMHGWTRDEIAWVIGVKRCTIDTHARKLFDRLGVHNRLMAVVAGANLIAAKRRKNS